MPHIGRIGQTALLNKEQFASRKLDAPDYDYNAESRKVIERLYNINDRDKMEIELFDNKLNLGFAIAEEVVKRGASFEQVLNFFAGYTAV